MLFWLWMTQANLHTRSLENWMTHQSFLPAAQRLIHPKRFGFLNIPMTLESKVKNSESLSLLKRGAAHTIRTFTPPGTVLDSWNGQIRLCLNNAIQSLMKFHEGPTI